MDSGKSTLALQTNHNHAARGRVGRIFTTHDRAGEAILSSRLGLTHDAIEVERRLRLLALRRRLADRGCPDRLPDLRRGAVLHDRPDRPARQGRRRAPDRRLRVRHPHRLPDPALPGQRAAGRARRPDERAPGRGAVLVRQARHPQRPHRGRRDGRRGRGDRGRRRRHAPTGARRPRSPTRCCAASTTAAGSPPPGPRRSPSPPSLSRSGPDAMLRPGLLVDVADLDGLDAVLLDTRLATTGPPGREQYDAGHLPGRGLRRRGRRPGRAARTAAGVIRCPTPSGSWPRCDAAGVRRDSTVVVYDAGPATAAARLWWLLRDYGHDDVLVLDGGLAAWAAAGRRVSTEPVRTADPGDWSGLPGPAPGRRRRRGGRVARVAACCSTSGPRERFRGETEPIDPVAGHVPGAVNAPLDRATPTTLGRFRSPEALRARFDVARRRRRRAGRGVLRLGRDRLPDDPGPAPGRARRRPLPRQLERLDLRPDPGRSPPDADPTAGSHHRIAGPGTDSRGSASPSSVPEPPRWAGCHGASSPGPGLVARHRLQSPSMAWRVTPRSIVPLTRSASGGTATGSPT